MSAVGSAWRPLTDAVAGLQIQTSTASAYVNFDTTNGRVGIGTVTPSTKLQVSGGDILLDNGGSYRAKDSTGTSRPLLNYTTANNLQLLNSAASGIVQVGINNASNTSNIRFTTGAGTEKMRIDNAGVGIGATTFGTSATNVLAIANGTIPGSSIVGGVQLYAESVASSSELRVRDEAGNVTTLSPHNFSAIPDGKSDPMAWAFYSQRGDLALNVDMLKTIRTVESLSGERLVYVKNLQTGEYQPETVNGVTLAGSGDASNIPSLETVNNMIATSNEELANDLIHKSEISQYVSWNDQVWSFLSAVVFQMQVTFQKESTFLASVVFKGPLTVNANTAGKVTLPAGATKLRVTFTQAFSTQPIVYLSPVQTVAGGYSLEEVTANDFVIVLNQPQMKDVQINWLAVMQGGDTQAKTQVIENGSQTPASSPSPDASPNTVVTPVPSATPEVSPTPEVTPSPAASTSASTASQSAAINP